MDNNNSNYKDVEYNSQTVGLKATHIEHNIDRRKGYYETDSQQTGFLAWDSVILEKEDHTILHYRNTEGTWNGKTFEIKGCETGSESNICRGLKHAVSKHADISVLYFKEGGFNVETFEKGLAKFNGLKNKEGQWKKFINIICIEKK